MVARQVNTAARGRRAQRRALDIVERCWPDCVTHKAVGHTNYRGQTDLFGIADIAVMRPTELTLIQVTHDSGLSKRKAKITDWATQYGVPLFCVIELWSWSITARRFRRFVWRDGWYELANITTRTQSLDHVEEAA